MFSIEGGKGGDINACYFDKYMKHTTLIYETLDLWNTN